MIVLVTGGRYFEDHAVVDRALDSLHGTSPITLLIHGAAEGVDTFAGEWAKTRGVLVSATPVTPEAWAVLGLAAGPARNAAMLAAACDQSKATAVPLVVVAFPGGRGTVDMLRRARARHADLLAVLCVYDDGTIEKATA